MAPLPALVLLNRDKCAEANLTFSDLDGLLLALGILATGAVVRANFNPVRHLASSLRVRRVYLINWK